LEKIKIYILLVWLTNLSCSFSLFLFFLFFFFFLTFLYRRLIVKDEIRGVLDEYTTKFSDVVKENQQLRKENLLLKNVY